MNITKELVDRYGMRIERIASYTGAAYNTVRQWYLEAKPMSFYQKRLDRLYKRHKEKKKKQGAKDGKIEKV